MQTLIFFFTSLLATVLVIKISAKQVGALKSGWINCLVALLFALIVLTTINRLLPSELAAAALAILVLGLVFESTLDTSFVKGMVVATAVVVIQWLVATLFGYLGVPTDLLSFIKGIA